MTFLLDTHLLLWAATEPERLSAQAGEMLEDPANDFIFSVVSIWEIAIKQALRREKWRADAGMVRRGYLENGYRELTLTGAHAVAIDRLPPIHQDPFDRILVAQAMVECISFMTSDKVLARYPGLVYPV